MKKGISIMILLSMLFTVVLTPDLASSVGNNTTIPELSSDYLKLVDNITTKYGLSDRQSNPSDYHLYSDEAQEGLKGLEYAKLIDFDNDGIKELLLIYNASGRPADILTEIWGHNGTKPYLVFSNGNSGDNNGEHGRYPFQIAGGSSAEIGLTKVDNHTYFYSKNTLGTGAELENYYTYHTIHNGKWEPKENFYTVEYYDEDNSLSDYYRNDKKVTEKEFNKLLSNFKNNSKTILRDFGDVQQIDKFNYKEFIRTLKNSLPPSLYLNSNTKIETNPIIVEGRTLVPLRALLEKMGAKVEWDGSTRTVKATKDNTTIIMKIDSKDATVNGKNVKLDVPAKLIDGKTFIPARFVGESFNYEVKWIAETKTILINSKR